METTTLRSYSFSLDIFRRKPFRNRGGLIKHNHHFHHPLVAETCSSLVTNSSCSVRGRRIFLNNHVPLNLNQKISLHCSNNLRSNLNVGARSMQSVHLESASRSSDDETDVHSSHDIINSETLPSRPKMFRNRFLSFVRLGSALNDAAEGFFNS